MKLDPTSLVGTARRLAKASGRGRPRQADLLRAVSTAYYALFHQLCLDYANFLVGKATVAYIEEAWRRAYRTASHGPLRTRAERGAFTAFGSAVQDFANLFVQMQKKRHTADYDPVVVFTRESVLADIDQVEEAIKQYRKASSIERRAFLGILTGFDKTLG